MEDPGELAACRSRALRRPPLALHCNSSYCYFSTGSCFLCYHSLQKNCSRLLCSAIISSYYFQSSFFFLLRPSARCSICSSHSRSSHHSLESRSDSQNSYNSGHIYWSIMDPAGGVDKYCWKHKGRSRSGRPHAMAAAASTSVLSRSYSASTVVTRTSCSQQQQQQPPRPSKNKQQCVKEAVKEHRARFYIVRRCVSMLVCWRDY